MRSALPVLLLAAGCAVTPVPVVRLQPMKLAQPGQCLETYKDDKAADTARATLRSDVRRLLARYPGRVVFMAHDLLTGVRFGYGEHEHDMITASGAKVDILTTLLARRHRLSAEENDLAELMIKESDNNAADALWWRVGGGEGVAGLYRRLGLRETTPGPSKYWGGTKTSPADRVKLMEALVRGGPGLKESDRTKVLRLMEQVQRDQAWGISAAAGPGDKVALKNGWTPRPFIHNTWAVTSYGRVHGPGRDLLLAVQTDQQPSHGTGIVAIEGVARLMRERLGALDPTKVRRCLKEPQWLRGPRPF
ncbi:serine hydrolase [Nonomuraea sp. NPDC049152]|uniref:serine hydrolase n=1 Tax=Nonomuraea sp. NPDC049152 TaxID=3154350 RepID=UPI0033F1F9DD